MTSNAALLVAGAALLAAGLGAGMWLRGPVVIAERVAPEPVAPPATGDIGDLRAELRAWTSELAAVRQRLDVQASPTAARVPVEGAALEQEALLDRLDKRMKLLIEALPAASMSRLPALNRSSWLNTDAIRSEFTRLVTTPEGDSGGPAWEAFNHTLAKEHVLWSLADVVSAYGRPDGASATDGVMRISFQLEGDRHLIFEMASDRVLSAGIE